jgi:hypothetical protein
MAYDHFENDYKDAIKTIKKKEVWYDKRKSNKFFI